MVVDAPELFRDVDGVPFADRLGDRSNIEEEIGNFAGEV